jgi:hypothetical protein
MCYPVVAKQTNFVQVIKFLGGFDIEPWTEIDSKANLVVND